MEKDSLFQRLGEWGLNSLPDYLRAAVRSFASSPPSESLEQARKKTGQPTSEWVPGTENTLLYTGITSGGFNIL